MTTPPRNSHPTFEETFPKAPFSELIRVTLAVAEKLVKLRPRLGAAGIARTGEPAHL